MCDAPCLVLGGLQALFARDMSDMMRSVVTAEHVCPVRTGTVLDGTVLDGTVLPCDTRAA